jgi:hypothetical protein
LGKEEGTAIAYIESEPRATADPFEALPTYHILL